MKWFLSILFLIFIYVFSTQASDKNSLPEGFVVVKEIIPGIQLEIRYASQDNFVGNPIDGYESPTCILSKEAAIALKNVQDGLKPFGLGLKVYDAYRPQRAVAHFVRWAEDLGDTKMKSRYYPNVKKKNLFRAGYIDERSGHSRGSTVDVTVVSLATNETEELDMGTKWDLFGPESWPSNLSLTPAQRAHRMLLQNVMTQYGFKPLKEEWWHFTLKDEPFANTYFDFPIR